MNSVHDMGGMQGFGPIVREENEPVFHAPWEARVMAIRRAAGATGILPPALRAAIETIPPAVYLRMSYYELWFAAVVKLCAAAGVLTANGPIPGITPLAPADAAAFPFRVPAVMLHTDAEPRFAVGQQVRARNLNPVGHTRLPRYVRGRIAVIVEPRGVQAFPDTHVHGRGEHPQHVYCVRFAARELWGEEASPRDSVYLDLWEDYLEPA
jgi:nitrile hydratase